MIPRFTTKDMNEVWDHNQRIRKWAAIEVAFLQARHEIVGDVPLECLKEAMDAPVPTAGQVNHHERHTQHDVVAFLELWTRNMSDQTASLVHMGLTSSDLVDTAMFDSLDNSLGVLIDKCVKLSGVLAVHDREANAHEAGGKRIGRTHGQYAEPTSVQHQMQTWQYGLSQFVVGAKALHPLLHVMKSPGATGCSHFFPTEVVARASNIMGNHGPVFSTQVIPRSRVVAWANTILELMVVLEAMAMEVRLSARSEVAEIRERANLHGSSAMPGKRNPIIAEKVTGLARLARGYHSAIAENAALHNDRDISNSSVERVAVIDLAQIADHAITQMTLTIGGAEFDYDRMSRTLKDNWPQAMASTAQFLLQRYFTMRSTEASLVVGNWLPTAIETGWTGLVEPLLAEGETFQSARFQSFHADLLMMEAQMGA